MLLQVGNVGQDGVVNILESVLLELQVDTGLEKYHLLLVEVFQDVQELTQCLGKLLGCRADGVLGWGGSGTLFVVEVVVLLGARRWIDGVELQLLINNARGLVGNTLKQLLVEGLKTLQFVNQLADVDTILLDSLSVDLHDLLADVTLVCAIGGLVAVVVIPTTSHLLHLTINWFLPINLRTKTVHALTHALHDLDGHV